MTNEKINEIKDSMGQLSATNQEKLFELLRAELTYEANLIAHRTSWFVASQAFFFTSVAAALDRTPGVPFTLKNSLLFPLIPQVALIVCLVILASVLAAIFSADQVRVTLIGLGTLHPLAKSFVTRNKWIIIGGLLPSFILPIVFAIAWIVILLS